MAEKDKPQQKPAKELPVSFGSFTSKETWDLYFATKTADDFSEWYADWPQLRTLLARNLLYPFSVLASRPKTPPPTAVPPDQLRILVPACGDSRLSEHLYDVGFRNIINLDYSKEVIAAMLRRNVKQRPGMRWRVMDITNMEFPNESFDAIIDKGGLDVLMDPGFGQKYPNLYITKVKQLLKVGGKYICLTLGDSKMLGLLFQKFRFGWKMNFHAIDPEPSSKNHGQQTFMVIVEKDGSTVVYQISPLLDLRKYHVGQVHELVGILRREKGCRSVLMRSLDIFYPLQDVLAAGNLTELQPGRRLKLFLGEYGISILLFKSILLDAQRDSGPFSHQFLVLIVPKVRTLQWILSSEEGQWVFVKEFKVARLAIILLDTPHSCFTIEVIQHDLTPLVKHLAPGDEVPIQFVVASEGIKQREVLCEVVSALNGPVLVDDLIFEKLDDALIRYFPCKLLKIRRFVVRSMVRSEAVLSVDAPNESASEVEGDNVQAASKTRKKVKQKKGKHTSRSTASSGEMQLCHNYLDSFHHNGIISGLMLIYLHLKGSTSSAGLVKTVVIGLKAGLLPMFMKNCLPCLHIEVVEVDPVIVDIARKYFGLVEDERLKVHITDAFAYLDKRAAEEVLAEEDHSLKLDILVVDVDSPLPTTSLASPAICFIEGPFLTRAKHSLSEDGLLIIHLVTSFSGVRFPVYSSLKKVFSTILILHPDEDANDEVIFALKKDSPVTEEQLSAAWSKLAASLELQEKQGWEQRVVDSSKLIKLL
ncbi:hypothetical protein ACP275_09G051600 [Erythranthe tilingii]